MRVRFAAGALLALAGAGVACSDEAAISRPNILLITVDTLRADHVSAYGAKVHWTPNLDRLARDGALFEAAYCNVTWTLPSVASTLTGMYAYRHGLRRSFNKLPDSSKSIAETLRDAGYATAAVIASFPLASLYGLNQGFDLYSEPPADALLAATTPPRTDPETTEIALEMLWGLAEKPQPFFFWVHYFGPHRRADPSLNVFHQVKRHLATYAQKVMATDAAVGDLLRGLAGLGLEDDTLVVLHADHGESLGEHRFVGHGRYLYEPTLRVPLILRWPGRIAAGLRVRGLAANLDIAATLLDAAGLSSEATAMDGRSLLPRIDGGGEAREALYIETYLPAQVPFGETVPPDEEPRPFPVRRLGLLSPPWKLVVTERFSAEDDPASLGPGDLSDRRVRTELYDLANDPLERAPGDGSSSRPEVADRLAHLLMQHREAVSRLRVGERLEPSEGDRTRLRELGYLE